MRVARMIGLASRQQQAPTGNRSLPCHKARYCVKEAKPLAQDPLPTM